MDHVVTGARWRLASALSGTALAALAATLTTAYAAAPRSAPRGAEVMALAFDAASGTLLKATADALYRSVDQGRDWTRLPRPAANRRGHIAAVAVSARGKGVLYLAGPGIGVLRSDDGGRHWSPRNQGLPGRDVVALAAHADQPEALFAYVSARGIFRSEDGGSHWRLMDRGPRAGILQLVHSNMPGSMQTGWFFAATSKGVSRSMDCFCGWRDAGGLGRGVSALAYDPREPRRVYAATGEGLFLSTDGGEQWVRVSAPAAKLVALAVTRSGALYAAAPGGALYRSVDQARTWEAVGA